ncbi:MAG: hypothetical protein H0X30_34740 [Anaerolineae bacterium]|nr:hypothetical protein [Anaerolineae bacterium]
MAAIVFIAAATVAPPLQYLLQNKFRELSRIVAKIAHVAVGTLVPVVI